jgi:hypothetical protein
MLRPEIGGDERLDAKFERLGVRVAEDLSCGRVPEYYLLGISLRDDDRVSYALEELANAQVLRFARAKIYSILLLTSN